MKIDASFYTYSDSWTDDRNPLVGRSQFSVLNYQIHQQEEYARIWKNAPRPLDFISYICSEGIVDILRIKIHSTLIESKQYED